MAPGYGVDPKHTSDLLAWDTVRERLARERNYWVATTRPNGRPHVMPVWGLWLDETFYFSTDPVSRKGRNLAASPYDVVVLEGRVEEAKEQPVLARYADAYEAKYQFRPNVDDPAATVYRLRHTVAFAWTEKDFPKSATRWTFGAK